MLNLLGFVCTLLLLKCVTAASPPTVFVFVGMSLVYFTFVSAVKAFLSHIFTQS